VDREAALARAPVSAPSRTSASTWRVLRLPLALAVVSATGLVAALMVQGGADRWATAAVAMPLLVGALAWWRWRTRA
jgi:hypothetical protein